MRKRYTSLLLFVLITFLLVFYVVPKTREYWTPGEVRAALDIGSGATNLKIAKVDPKSGKILLDIFQKSIEVPYQKELEKSPDQRFNDQVMAKGTAAIQELKNIADQYRAKKVVAVATAAFRKALNAQQFAADVEKQTGVRVRIIDQDEEGILAFRGALALQTIDPNHAVVWDIGGGSMQLTTLSDGGTYLIDKGQTASALFKNLVIQQVKHQDPLVIHTPNPLSQVDMQQAVDIASNLSQTTDPFVKEKILRSNTQVLAVGNLFNYSVLPLVTGKEVSRDALWSGVIRLADKEDSNLPGGAFADVAVTNPLMVLGYMNGLKIDKVKVVDVNNTDGVLTFPLYWQE